jgi:uncharacterized membrane protein
MYIFKQVFRIRMIDNKLAVNYLIKFVIKVLFMTPLLNFTPFECLSDFFFKEYSNGACYNNLIFRYM